MKHAYSRAKIVRLALLLAGAGVTASLLLGTEPHADQPAAAVTKAREAAPGRADKSIPPLDLSSLGRALTLEVRDNLFAVPAPPPPPVTPVVAPAPVVMAPPPKPTAPPLPFTFLGRLIDKGATTVFVSHNGTSLSLKQGDTAADLYRVERITADEIVFVYQPLTEKQVLAIGRAN